MIRIAALEALGQERGAEQEHQGTAQPLFLGQLLELFDLGRFEGQFAGDVFEQFPLMVDGGRGRFAMATMMQDQEKHDQPHRPQQQGDDAVGAWRLVHAGLGALEDIFERGVGQKG